MVRWTHAKKNMKRIRKLESRRIMYRNVPKGVQVKIVEQWGNVERRKID